VTTKKKGHYKKSQRGYISPICGEFPTQPNLTKIGLWLGVADVINRTKFGDDRSRCHWRCFHTISALFTAIKGNSALQHYFHAD